MRPIGVPHSITAEVSRLANSIARDGKLHWVEVRPDTGAVVSECFYNVREYVAMNGGSQIYGWIIWEMSGVFLEAEHHSVHVSNDGVLVDVTPKVDGEEQILFLQDDRAKFYFPKPKWKDNCRFALDCSPEVLAYLKAAEKLSRFELRHSKTQGRRRMIDIGEILVEHYTALQDARRETGLALREYLARKSC